MFDEIEIDGERVKVYFDIENFKLKIDRYDLSIIEPKINQTYVKIKNYVLRIKYLGQHNNYSYEYDVLFYIHCYYDYFSPINVNRVLIGSEEISSLLYSKKLKKKKEYIIDNEDYKFTVTFNRNNKIQRWHYNNIKTGGNVEINIEKCNDWETYSNIIIAVIDSISVTSLNRKNNNFEILLCGESENYIGSMVFQKISESEKYLSIGNIDIVEKDISKIISTLVESPLESQYVIPRYSNYYDQLEFYKLYACFEFEYKKIDISKMYSKVQKSNVRKSENMKKQIIKLLKESKLEITEHYYNSLNNYNPQEGHKQKLLNAIEYSKQFLSERYEETGFYDIEKSFVDYVYKTRIKIIHEPNDDINIENTDYMSRFNELVYALFLKRCGISNRRIQKICKAIFIPYV